MKKEYDLNNLTEKRRDVLPELAPGCCNLVSYKGYMGQAIWDETAGIFHGEIVGVSDVITFQVKTKKALNEAFQHSVDDYLVFCNERGEAPNLPSK